MPTRVDVSSAWCARRCRPCWLLTPLKLLWVLLIIAGVVVIVVVVDFSLIETSNSRLACYFIK